MKILMRVAGTGGLRICVLSYFCRKVISGGGSGSCTIYNCDMK